VFDRDPKFTSIFSKELFKGFGTNLNFSTTYHLQSNGQTERVNQVIEDMLRMYFMDKTSKWEDCIQLIEFSYNNGYQTSLNMSPFEALYGRRYKTPVSWDNPVDRVVVGPELISEMDDLDYFENDMKKEIQLRYNNEIHKKIWKRAQKYSETQLLLLNKIEKHRRTQTGKMG
jgi:hypothetical protein